MSENKPKGRKLQLPEIPVGVKPAASPLTARAVRALSTAAVPPRSPNLTKESWNQPQKENVVTMAGIPKSTKDGEDSSVCVAVRVRPFSQRDKMMNATQVVSMAANRISITSNTGKVHMFTYDHCFWSAEGGTKEGGVAFAGQEQVYTELARPLLDNSFKGYNTCLFAYGQTGSGKSYCIMGEGEELGIVPRFANELFARVEGTSNSKNTYNVQVSYYEIYKEKVFDLLRASNKDHREKTKLRVREHQMFGPYVEDLSTFVASSYSDIEHWLKVGNRVRATSATSMNDRSSRSHAVFSITLTHTTLEEEEEHSTVSRINIIDLAGSERSKVAETSGDRLKEGASINRSLHTLGKIISLLAERSTGRRDKVYIPYRDSTLTWLLKDSLGGNSKTAMIATVNPAHLHYEESLSTLRYAQQARNIVNVVHVNEDPNVRIIRELTGEIQQLRDKLSLQGGEAGLVEIKHLREQLSESEKLRTAMTRSWQEKLKESDERKKQELEQLKKSGLTVNSRLPNLVNLTEDPQLSETLLYILPPGHTTVGNSSSGQRRREQEQDGNRIQLSGALVSDHHCVFIHDNHTVQLEPSSDPEAKTYVNGCLLSTTSRLHHGDRVVLGGNYFFRFNHPQEVGAGKASKMSKKMQRDFEYARNELIRAQTERIEREMEEKRLRERHELLSQLEQLQASKQAEYQQEIQRLAQEMAEKSVRLHEEEETKEAAEQRVAELMLRNQTLEQETVSQRHIIHLEKLKTEKESKDLEEQKNQLMDELEQEKMKLEDDIRDLNDKKNLRELNVSSADSLLVNGVVGGDTSLLRGSDLVRVSVMLQEASAISKALNKPLTFSREERGGAPCVRVSNSQLNMVSYWDMCKFELRLDQMRDVYHHQDSSSASLSSTSLASGDTDISAAADDPFNDPSDDWAPSPLRSLQRMQTNPGLATPLSLSLALTPSSSSSSAQVNRQLDFSTKQIANKRRSLRARYSSPHLLEDSLTPPSMASSLLSQSGLSLWEPLAHGMGMAIGQLVHRRTGGTSQIIDEDEEEEEEEESVFQRMAGYMCKIKTDCEQVRHLTLPGSGRSAVGREDKGSEQLGVFLSSVTLCVEGLYESCSSLHERCVQEAMLMGHLPQGHAFSASHISYRLLQTLSEHCTTFAVSLHKCEGGEELRECLHSLSVAMHDLAGLLGQLLLATQLNASLLYTHLRSRSEGDLVYPEQDRAMDSVLQYPLIWPWTEEEGLKYAMAQGVGFWCTQVLETLSRSLEHTFKTFTGRTPHKMAGDQDMTQVSEMSDAVRLLAEAVMEFTQYMLQIQTVLWSDQEDAVSVPQAVHLLLPLHRLVICLLRSLRSRGSGWEGPNPVLVCNQVGVAALTLAGSHSYSTRVQLMSQNLVKTARRIPLTRT